MKAIKGHLVKKWVAAVDKLCDSDPTYDWNDGCRAVAHALENENVVTMKKIEKAAMEFWGNNDSRDFRITVTDVESCMTGTVEIEDNDGIPIMKPLRLRR